MFNSQKYAFIVTGASGNVGRRLIPLLARRGDRILALGRNSSILNNLYGEISNVDVADYRILSSLTSCDTLVHLAILNNNHVGTLEEFKRANIEFALDMCNHFRRLGGGRFVNLASVHSFDDQNDSFYATSKSLSSKRMEEVIGSHLDNVYIGYFYDTEYFGQRLRFLPKKGLLGPMVFHFFKILKPTTSAASLAAYISCSNKSLNDPKIVTDDVNEVSAFSTIRRVCDLAVALFILVGLFPVLLLIWTCIWFDSPGRPIFAQTRVGRNKKTFTLYKFRTMKRDTISAGTHEVNVNAVTTIGKFLRRTKLDELPQAINLLRGEMTLVGPRPCLPTQKELIDARSRLGVYALMPGITGYAQIREIDMSHPEELARNDAIFMKLQSLSLNFKILLLTALGRGGGDRVISPIKPRDDLGASDGSNSKAQ